ncbi:MAG TPA: hypothetical protein VLW50_24135 [Streptosporangiaceae bacterium]|nr:hypothetical protein [Streptosporangiaceae bacterium]
MILRYAKIAIRTVADEYFAVTEKVQALSGQRAQLPTRYAATLASIAKREFLAMVI